MSFPDSQMMSIPIENMIGGVKLPVDLFVKLSANHYLMVAKAGTYTPADRFADLEDRHVSHLYIRHEDHHVLITQNLIIINTIFDQTDQPMDKKAQLLTQVGSTVLAEIKKFGISKRNFDHAKRVAENAVTLLEQDIALNDIMRALGESPKLVNHSIAVCMISLLIAKGLQWRKRLTLEKIAVGALLHDVGLRDLPEHLTKVPISLMTPEEIAIYQSHPFHGFELVRAIPTVPDDVAAIIYEHHENSLGEGYPRQIKDAWLNPLSRVVALANAFTDLTLESPAHQQQSPREAILYIENILGQPFNKEAFRALKQVVALREAA